MPEVVMMLAFSRLSSSPRYYSSSVIGYTKSNYLERIETITTIVIEAFQQVFQIPHPRIHVLGLNQCQ